MMHDLSQIKALVFDLDGTLIDSEPIHAANEKRAFKEFGLNVLDFEWKGFKGKSALNIARYVIGKYGNGTNLTPEQFVERKTKLYLEVVKNIRFIEGAQRFLHAVKGSFDLGLVTSSKKVVQEAVFNNLEMNGIFKAIVTADDIKEEEGKPHPMPFAKGIKLLGMRPE